MGASASRNWLVGVSTLEPEPEEPLGLGQLPTELLEMVLSHVPPHVLLGRCRRVCRRWRALVDCQALWLDILARDHAALWPVLRTCLPPADDPRPCVLGRFCELRPIGRNLLRNPKGEGGEPRKGVLLEGAGGRGRMRGALGLRGWAWNWIPREEPEVQVPAGNPRGLIPGRVGWQGTWGKTVFI